MSETSLLELSLAQKALALAERKFSSLELAQATAEQAADFNQTTQAFISLDLEQFLDSAKIYAAQLSAPNATALTGIPVVVQDMFATEGVLTTAASKMLANFVAPYNAAVIEKLKQAGAVILGKTNLPEFGVGASTQTSFYGAVQNSGQEALGAHAASALAVSSGLAGASLDVDKGLLRETAAIYGLSALKPTYGRVSRWGMLAGAPSLEQPAIMAKDAASLGMVLQEIAGADARDALSSQVEVGNYLDVNSADTKTTNANTDLQGKKIGLIKSAAYSATEEQHLASLSKELTKLGCELIEIEIPLSAQVDAVFALLSCAEFSSSMSRFDGVRFGYRCDQPQDLEDMYKRSRSEGLGALVQREIIQGTYVLGQNSYASHYHKAQQTRRLIVEAYQTALEQADFLLSPTQGHSLAANLTGMPALSLPAAHNKQFSWQLMGKHFAEADLLALARLYQQQTAS